MNDLNYILLDGILTRAPSIRSITADVTVCQFVVANNRYYKKKDKETFSQDASFFYVETWGEVATFCAKKLNTGIRVRILGRLKQARWNENGDTEKPREKTYIVAEHVEIHYTKKTEVIKSTKEETSETSANLDNDAVKAAEIGKEDENIVEQEYDNSQDLNQDMEQENLN